MNTQQTVRVLPADVYDALELSAYVYKGVGRWYMEEDNGAPNCIIGQARFLDDASWTGEVETTLRKAGINIVSNDDIVRDAINAGKGKKNGRISWREYVKRANIVRGEN